MTQAKAPPRILVVDDDPIALLVTRTHLEKGGYGVDCVESVAEARTLLTRAGRPSYEAVVSDYRMPGENGLALLQFLGDAEPSLAFIMATAEGEKRLVASSMRAGAVDFLEKPFSRAELLAAVQRAVSLTASQRARVQAVDEVAQMGRTQRMLLGQSTVKLADRFHVFFRPHVQAGGDFVAAFPVSPGRFIVLVSDISGHDAQAAYRSAYLQGYARATLANGSDIAHTFGQLNALLMQEWNTNDEEILSLAACAVDVDLNQQTLNLLNCGLPSPFLLDREGWPLPLDTARSSPLGWFNTLPSSCQLRFADDRLVFWSDGMDDLGERLGCDPLAIAHRLLGDPRNAVDLLGAACDDIIVVRLELGAPETLCVQRRVPLFHQRLAGSSHAEIDQHQDFLERSLLTALPGLSAQTVHDALICTREALLNALHHGCQCRPDRFTTVQVVHDPRAQVLAVRVTDEGEGYEVSSARPGEAQDCSLLPEHHGLLMMRCLTHQLNIADKGRVITMEFSTPPQE